MTVRLQHNFHNHARCSTLLTSEHLTHILVRTFCIFSTFQSILDYFRLLWPTIFPPNEVNCWSTWSKLPITMLTSPSWMLRIRAARSSRRLASKPKNLQRMSYNSSWNKTLHLFIEKDVATKPRKLPIFYANKLFEWGVGGPTPTMNERTKWRQQTNENRKAFGLCFSFLMQAATNRTGKTCTGGVCFLGQLALLALK